MYYSLTPYDHVARDATLTISYPASRSTVLAVLDRLSAIVMALMAPNCPEIILGQPNPYKVLVSGLQPVEVLIGSKSEAGKI